MHADEVFATAFLSLYKKDIKLYRTAEVNPDNFRDYSALGLAYIRDDQYEKAKEALNTAVIKDPYDYSAYANLAITETKLKNYDEALKYYEKAFKINPDIPNSFSFNSSLSSVVLCFLFCFFLFFFVPQQKLNYYISLDMV